MVTSSWCDQSNLNGSGLPLMKRTIAACTCSTAWLRSSLPAMLPSVLCRSAAAHHYQGSIPVSNHECSHRSQIVFSCQPCMSVFAQFPIQCVAYSFIFPFEFSQQSQHVRKICGAPSSLQPLTDSRHRLGPEVGAAALESVRLPLHDRCIPLVYSLP